MRVCEFWGETEGSLFSREQLVHVSICSLSLFHGASNVQRGFSAENDFTAQQLLQSLIRLTLRRADCTMLPIVTTHTPSAMQFSFFQAKLFHIIQFQPQFLLCIIYSFTPTTPPPQFFLCLIHFKCRTDSFFLLFLLLSICLSSLLSLLRQS